MLTALLLELLMAAPLALEGTGVPAQVRTLEDARWEHRVLLLFPGDRPEAWAEQQRRLEAARAQLEEREVLVVVVGDGVGNGVGGASHAPVRLPDEDAARKRWKVAPGQAEAVLLGKDGGEKWRAPLPASLEPVVTLIDSMPMRQREVRERAP